MVNLKAEIDKTIHEMTLKNTNKTAFVFVRVISWIK